MEEPDLYAILQVPSTAGPEEIRRAYRALLRQHHPDLHKPHDAVEARRLARNMASIMHAYEVLADPQRRAAYDRSRLSPRAAPAPGGVRINVRVHRSDEPRPRRHDEPRVRGDDEVRLFPAESPLRPPPDVFERLLRRWFLQ